MLIEDVFFVIKDKDTIAFKNKQRNTIQTIDTGLIDKFIFKNEEKEKETDFNIEMNDSVSCILSDQYGKTYLNCSKSKEELYTES